MQRKLVLSSILAVALVSVLVAGAFGSGRDRQKLASPGPQVSRGPVLAAVSFDGDLRELPAPTPADVPRRFHEPHEPFGLKQGGSTEPLAPTPEPALRMPTPSQSFNGIGFASGGGGWPPDTVGDVGPSHYVQAVNTSFAVYGKTGTLLAGPTTFNALWPNTTGTPCDSSNTGDPTVLYDALGDRWVLADFAFGFDAQGADVAPYYECIAVSKTSDPVSGGWWLYPVRVDDAGCSCLGDYPKMGIWPDGLYMTASMFAAGSGPFQHTRVWAFNRTALESGTLQSVLVTNVNAFSLLPSNLRGALPPAGRANILVAENQSTTDYDVYRFTPNYATPAASTFTGPTLVSQASYSFNFGAVDTPGNDLDSLEDRVLMQAQYRNLAGVESIWVNHTVPLNSSGLPKVIQWAQLNVTGGTISTTPVQEAVYGNVGGDGLSRWLGSLAVDKDGNMALGYSAAGPSAHPSIRYVGRLASDPVNTLPQGETTLVSGGGSQTGNCGGFVCTRWGDYSAMSVDPDGCTFWYTTEYYASSGTSWQTKIGSFKFPSCSGVPTAVGMRSLSAVRVRGGVSVRWRTGSEAALLGFDVFRVGAAGGTRKVNPAPVPAHGRAGGSAYRFVDRTAKPGRPYTYRLRVTERDGSRSWYGAGVIAS